ncbi:monocarboxylate transporter 13-like [Tubulanus polymorphus]|uniref:monocarboxylate transporter 13-like n=1 Tax=Tubulanus polymorphus TaxID=672921 RepID=UPI003DA3F5AC
MASTEKQDDKFEEEFKEPGRIEGCCLVVAAAGIVMLIGGMQNTTGILVVEWVEYFNTGYTIVSWIGASGGLTLTFAPIAGVVIKRFGLRRCLVSSAIVSCSAICGSAFSTKLWHMYILWMISGFVSIFHFGPVVAYVLVRFRRYRSIANAFVVSAATLGTFIYGVIMNTLIEIYTWRGAVLITGAMTLNVIPCSLVLRKWNRPRCKEDVLLDNNEEEVRDRGDSDNTQMHLGTDTNTETPTERCSGCSGSDSEVLKQPALLGLILPVLFLSMSVSILYVHTVSGFMDVCKLDLENARYLVPCLGASITVSRFVVSTISQHPRVDTFTLFLMANVLLSVTVALIPVFEGFTAAVVLVVIIGVGLSAFGGITHLVIAEIIDDKHIHMAVQYMFLPAGIGYMIGAPIIGWLYDATGNYIYSFELTAVLVAFSVLTILPFWIKHFRSLSSENLSKEICRIRPARGHPADDIKIT